jgi:hypothetical protein
MLEKGIFDEVKSETVAAETETSAAPADKTEE